MNPVDELFWRDEVLQALFWLRGEGLASASTAADLARFLVADEATIALVLAGLEGDGYVEPGYRLTELGMREGGRRFRDEFAGLTQQAHGECGPGCWCHDPEHESEPCPARETKAPEGSHA